MSHDTGREIDIPGAESRGRRKRRTRSFVASTITLALLTFGAVLLTATAAGADAPNPASPNTGTAVLNADGTITVTVQGHWNFGNTCPDFAGKTPGFAIDWGDNMANALVNGLFVGTADDNVVHIANNDCDATTHIGSWGPISHTYSAADFAAIGGTVNGTDPESTTTTPCVVTYHVDQNMNPATGAHSLIAGGTGHNTDNNVEDNMHNDDISNCAPIAFEPDVAVQKTGPANGTVGTNITYTLTATNTGGVAADDVTITDVIPSGATFVSATSPCTFDTGTVTVTCDVGTLAIGDHSTVQITVTPTAAGTLTNTAVVTPNDATPSDNTSSVSTEIVAVAPANANVSPAAAVTVAPAFTG